MAKGIGAEAAWALAGAMAGTHAKVHTGGVAQATVTRIGDDGTVWVHMPGGVDETPADCLSPGSLAAGDHIEVRVSDGRAMVSGSMLAESAEKSVAVTKEVVSAAVAAAEYSAGTGIDISGRTISVDATQISYADLQDKPSIEAHELVGNSSLDDISVHRLTNSEIDALMALADS